MTNKHGGTRYQPLGTGTDSVDHGQNRFALHGEIDMQERAENCRIAGTNIVREDCRHSKLGLLGAINMRETV